MKALNFSYDENLDVVTIEGIRYGGNVFRQFGSLMPAGMLFRLDKRKDGVICVTTIGIEKPTCKRCELLEKVIADSQRRLDSLAAAVEKKS